MSVAYHLHSRSGISKNSGRWYCATTLLYLNGYGTPTTEVVYWDSKDSADNSDLAYAIDDSDNRHIAHPVLVSRTADGRRLERLSILDDIPPLDLSPLFVG